jgi:hypothetical protein
MLHIVDAHYITLHILFAKSKKTWNDIKKKKKKNSLFSIIYMGVKTSLNIRAHILENENRLQ